MRSAVWLLSLFMIVTASTPVLAQEPERSDVIIGKMSFKLVRGVTNAATCIVELPKQTYLSARDGGASGYAIGPLKGIGMTLYRAFIGVTETVLFMVPQPGYYDSMINPDFVWKGWEEPRPDSSKPKGNESSESQDGVKEK